MSLSKHLLRLSNGHLARKANGHLLYVSKLMGDRVENCCATYTRETVTGGYRNHYTIYHVPLVAALDAYDNPILLASYSDKVMAYNHTGDVYTSFFDGPLWEPYLYPAATPTITKIKPNAGFTSWEMIAASNNTKFATTRSLGTVTGSTAAGIYDNLIDDGLVFKCTVFID